MLNEARFGRVMGTLIGTATLFVLGCSPVKDKAHDLSNAFSGNYDAVLTTTPDAVIAATRAAVQDLHLILISEKKEQSNATSMVVARSADDEKVTVGILPFGGDQTRVTVSTGVFGNSTLRQQVMDAIKIHLGTAALRQSPPATQPVP